MNMSLSKCLSVSPSLLLCTVRSGEYAIIEADEGAGYVADEKNEPILPPGMKEHLKADLDRTIDDF